MFYVHRSLPPTPEQYYADLWSEVNALRDAISMPRQKISRLTNATEQGKLSAEEYATLKRLLEKRVRKTAQVTAVTRDDTVQQCSPCSPDPDRPSGVCFNLENEGRMDPELEKLKSSAAGTGLNTPGQQCPPNKGIRETGRTAASGTLTAGASSSKKRNISTSTRTVEGISSTAATLGYRRLKRFSEENKQFDPGGQREKAPPWDVAVTLPFFFGGELGSSVLLSVCASCSVLSVCLFFSRNYFFLFRYTSQQAESHKERSRIKPMKYANGGQAFSRLILF